jgi:hypothetical protein
VVVSKKEKMMRMFGFENDFYVYLFMFKQNLRPLFHGVYLSSVVQTRDDHSILKAVGSATMTPHICISVALGRDRNDVAMGQLLLTRTDITRCFWSRLGSCQHSLTLTEHSS